MLSSQTMRFGNVMTKKPAMTKDAALKRRGRPAAQGPDPDARTGINHPGMNDVMFGRGGDTNYHIGNNSFRHLVESFSDQYWAAKNRKEKSSIIGLIINGWRTQDPPGRFLAKTDPAKGDDSLWHDVGDQVAGRKASKILSEMRIGKRNKAAKAGAKRAAATKKTPARTSSNKTPLAATSSCIITDSSVEQTNPRKRKAQDSPSSPTGAQEFPQEGGTFPLPGGGGAFPLPGGESAAKNPSFSLGALVQEDNTPLLPPSKRRLAESMPVAAELTHVFEDPAYHEMPQARHSNADDEEAALMELIGA
ncbi:expressed unknown protein [Seminavis robusta]|uniref:DUF6824 domain-containing protein n=1 Tax=Seminavis robusta TaxID=568900 RepID=A0A9N8H4V3_9STRA|nr:expressed unknown protein [Seminavis robusta]|eukprot:Sro13_g010230.1 n/a (306) ;mRNA; f:159484-161055